MRALNVRELYEYGDELIARHAARDQLYERMDRLYFQEREEEGEDEYVQRVTLPLATNAVDLVADLASTQELAIEVAAVSESRKAKEEADALERWFASWLRMNERYGRGNFRHQMAWYAAMRGMVVVRVLPDIDGLQKYEGSGEIPVVLQVREPARVYCDWGPRGLRAVVEEYERTYGSVMREYGKVLSDEEYTDGDVVRWREYWDAERCAYWVNGEPVRVGGRLVRPHAYGCIPYGVAWARSTPVGEPHWAARPMLAGVERLIENIEVLASIMATAGVHVIDSAFAVYGQRYGTGESQLQLDLTPGAINYFDPSLGERIEAIQRPPLPQDIYQLMTLFLAQFQQGTFPVAMYGEVGRQMAGYAINLMTQSGRRALLPIWGAVERAHEIAIEKCVEIVRELVGPAYGKPLPLTVEEEGEGRRLRRRVELDWQKLPADFEVRCRLGDPLPADRASNLRMAIEAVRAGLLSQETALTDYGIVQDATEEMMRIFVERVVAKSIDEEARRVAIARGYLQEVGHEGMGGAADVGADRDAAPFVHDAGALRGALPIDELQMISGQPQALPELQEMAGELPPEAITQVMGGAYGA